MIAKPLLILLVEDNDDHAELMKRGFEENLKSAISLMRVSDGEEALDYLFNLGKYSSKKDFPSPGLIFLDLRLPKMDGLEVLAKIKSSGNLHTIPVVVLTSSESEKDMVKAYSEYVNSYLVKPLDFVKFTEMMQQLGFYWMELNKRPSVKPFSNP